MEEKEEYQTKTKMEKTGEDMYMELESQLQNDKKNNGEKHKYKKWQKQWNLLMATAWQASKTIFAKFCYV